MENFTGKKLTITEWAEEDRPREKLLLKGVAALSDAELLAILIGSGNKNETAVELSKRILKSVGNDLNKLGKVEVNDLIKNFNGIGEAKAITIAAAMELGRRRILTKAEKIPKIQTSSQAYEILLPIMGDLKHEEMWILLLNNSNKIIKRSLIHKGTNTNVLVDIKLILKEAIESLATGIILAHNHPNGDISPSENDDEITTRLKEAARYMDIALLDHLIVCDGEYYSYKEMKRFF